METINFKSRTFVLICLFMINQYVLGLDNNLPLTESRFVAERPNSILNQDALRNSGLFSFFKNFYTQQNDDPNQYYNQELDKDDINRIVNYYKKRTASKGSSKQWNNLHNLIGKRNEQLDEDQILMRLAGKRDDPKSKHEKGWNQLNSMWG